MGSRDRPDADVAAFIEWCVECYEGAPIGWPKMERMSLRQLAEWMSVKIARRELSLPQWP
jgi:hypothetical protein